MGPEEQMPGFRFETHPKAQFKQFQNSPFPCTDKKALLSRMRLAIPPSLCAQKRPFASEMDGLAHQLPSQSVQSVLDELFDIQTVQQAYCSQFSHLRLHSRPKESQPVPCSSDPPWPVNSPRKKSAYSIFSITREYVALLSLEFPHAWTASGSLPPCAHVGLMSWEAPPPFGPIPGNAISLLTSCRIGEYQMEIRKL